MGKNNKNATKPVAPAAPAANKSELVISNTATFNSSAIKNLDPNHQVELLSMLNQRFFLDKDAAAHTGFSEENIAKINEITACGLVVVMAEEIISGNSNFALRMRPAQLNAIMDISKSMGIEINPAALPAPEENGNVTVVPEAVEISEETKKKIKEERELAEKTVELDPTKIENKDQLVEALKQIMIKNPNLYQKIAESINFYRAYLGVLAHRSKKKEETERVKNMTTVEIFNEIADIVGSCPLVMSGIGNHLYTVTASTKSPIAAFCALRNSSRDRKTGVYAIDDATVADYVKILIKWHVNIQIENANAAIETLNKDIALLSDDKEKNAAGIADLEAKIETKKKNIEHFEEVLGYVMNPSSEFVNKFMDNYLAHEKNEMRVFKSICECFYDDIEVKEMKQDGVRKNVHQYVGIVTNLFRSGTDAIEGYSAANLVELEPIAQEKTTSSSSAEEPKTAEKESKDSKKSKKQLLPLGIQVRAY